MTKVSRSQNTSIGLLVFLHFTLMNIEVNKDYLKQIISIFDQLLKQYHLHCD